MSAVSIIVEGENLLGCIKKMLTQIFCMFGVQNAVFSVLTKKLCSRGYADQAILRNLCVMNFFFSNQCT